jgi:hypothetical protein
MGRAFIEECAPIHRIRQMPVGHGQPRGRSTKRNLTSPMTGEISFFGLFIFSFDGHLLTGLTIIIDLFFALFLD